MVPVAKISGAGSWPKGCDVIAHSAAASVLFIDCLSTVVLCDTGDTSVSIVRDDPCSSTIPCSLNHATVDNY